MSAKKHKRKIVKHSHHSKKGRTSPSLLSRHPRLFLAVGIVLVIISALLISIGYVSDARVGLSMIALFFGGGLVIVANSALPKN